MLDCSPAKRMQQCSEHKPPTTTTTKMRLAVGAPKPSTSPYSSNHLPLTHSHAKSPLLRHSEASLTKPLKRISLNCSLAAVATASSSANSLAKKWMEYQGINDWEGLLDPLDDNLRQEIIRYGLFVEAAYRSFDFDPSSPTYATCKFPKNSLFDKSGIGETGYRLTKNLRASSGVQLPRWIDRAPSWVSAQSSWIGYVAVCQDKEEIARLGRRDVVIAYRGTATCLEWLENLRATLTCLNGDASDCDDDVDINKNNNNYNNTKNRPMVESGFLSLYTSGTATCPSLQTMIREEIARIIDLYGDEPLSITITGHSLGAALATLTAHDITSTFRSPPMVSVISFGGPRVGNQSFRRQLERTGTRILRIVNSDDLITKVPGFVIDNNDVAAVGMPGGLPSWLHKHVPSTQWAYAEVGQELRLSSKESPYLNKRDIATCHELSTYLHLVSGFVSSTCPFRATARKMLNMHHREKLGFRQVATTT